jgi:hypothetical protein
VVLKHYERHYYEPYSKYTHSLETYWASVGVDESGWQMAVSSRGSL